MRTWLLRHPTVGFALAGIWWLILTFGMWHNIDTHRYVWAVLFAIGGLVAYHEASKWWKRT